MKSTFVKGTRVHTIDRVAKKIRRGSMVEPIVESGVVIGNEHFGRIVKVKLDNGQIVSTRPEYLEIG